MANNRAHQNTHNFYFVDFFKCLFVKERIGVWVWMLLNLFLIELCCCGTAVSSKQSEDVFEGLLIGLILYIIGVILSLSPVGETLLRRLNKCKKIRNIDQKTRVYPIFNRVYSNVRKKDPSISSDIKLFISGDEFPNAFATGRKTVCLTEGLLELTDDEIEAIFAHEFGHLAHKDTDVLLISAIGNMFVTIVLNFLSFISNIGCSFASLFSENSKTVYKIMNCFFFLVSYMWTKLGALFCLYSNRKSEYNADAFATALGYGQSLINALIIIENVNSKHKAKGFWATLSQSHPDTKDRISMIKEQISINQLDSQKTQLSTNYNNSTTNNETTNLLGQNKITNDLKKHKGSDEKHRVKKTHLAEKISSRAEDYAWNAWLVIKALMPIIVVIIVFILIILKVVEPGEKYKEAMKLINSGDYKAASILLDGLDYKDSIKQRLALAEVGSEVTLGVYEQNNAFSPFEGKESIQWIVLSKENNILLLVSKYGLDNHFYNSETGDVTWETSAIRSWLNEDFLNDAFTKREQQLLKHTLVKAENNPWSSSNPGKNTVDQVFLLSYKEVARYFNSDEERKCAPTKYAKSKGVRCTNYSFTSENKPTCEWWLRTVGGESGRAAIVNNKGSAGVNTYYDGTVIYRDDEASLIDAHAGLDSIAVRPAVVIDLESTTESGPFFIEALNTIGDFYHWRRTSLSHLF